MIYLLKILIVVCILAFSRTALFIFNKNANLSSLSLILSQTFSVLIWINILTIILNSDISKLSIYIGIAIQLISLSLFWSHIPYSGRTSIETADDIRITIPNYGLFQYIRYPIFTIYLLNYFSTFILFKDITGLILSIFMALIYLAIGRNRDAQMLESELSAEYQDYMNKTGLLTPKP